MTKSKYASVPKKASQIRINPEKTGGFNRSYMNTPRLPKKIQEVNVGTCVVCGGDIIIPTTVAQIVPDLDTCCRKCGMIKLGTWKGVELDDEAED